MIVYLVRLLWIAAQVLCLIEIDVSRSRYRWWTAYILVSALVTPFFAPELIPGLANILAPLTVACLLLRTCACLEALHLQTSDFPWWSRMMAGSFLFAAFVVCVIALVRDGRWAGLLVEYRRYLQIWTFLVLALVEMLLLSVGWFRRRPQDFHAAILLALAGNHARVSISAMIWHPTGQQWREADWIATLLNALILFAWVFATRIVRSTRAPGHAVAVVLRVRS